MTLARHVSCASFGEYKKCDANRRRRASLRQTTMAQSSAIWWNTIITRGEKKKKKKEENKRVREKVWIKREEGRRRPHTYVHPRKEKKTYLLALTRLLLLLPLLLMPLL